MTKPTLDELRKEIEKVDNEIVSLVAKRLEIAESIGQFKIDHCMTIKAFDVEKKVNERYKELSEKFGIHSELSKDLSKLLIDHACRVQEQKRFNSVASDYKTTNSPGKAVIIGGAGNMGKWFYNFLNSFGYECVVKDLDKSNSKLAYLDDSRDLSEFLNSVDVIVVATSLSSTAEVLTEVAKTNTKALVFDIASLKSPIISTLNEAGKSLPNLVSVHPMFGPSVDLLTGENILVCDLGNKEATEKAVKLFGQTAANVTITTPEGHDELMAEVLGLSHIINLLFAHSLSETGLTPQKIQQSKSTTFKNQLEVSSIVASENPSLYFDIQHLNAFTPALYERIRKSFEHLTSLVLLNDKDNFNSVMSSYSKLLDKLS